MKKLICNYCNKELYEVFTSFPEYEIRYECSCGEYGVEMEIENNKLEDKIFELEDDIEDNKDALYIMNHIIKEILIHLESNVKEEKLFKNFDEFIQYKTKIEDKVNKLVW